MHQLLWTRMMFDQQVISGLNGMVEMDDSGVLYL